MSRDSKRIYNSEARNARATQTKGRILLNAKKLFQSDGLEYVTIEKIAKAAGVSVPTVYSIFKSKLGILRALMDEALPAEQFEALVKKAKREQSPKNHLFITAKIARQIYDAEKANMDIFQGTSVLAPEFKELEKEREQRRYKRLELTMKIITGDKPIKKGLSISKAHDILWAFTGRDLYRMLVIEQQWASETYEAWLAQLLVITLIEPDMSSEI